MKKPSPTAHLQRLALVFVVGFICFVTIKSWAMPNSWNHDMDNWFRLNTLDDQLKQTPAYANDNKACSKACHKNVYKKFRKKKHKGLSCDSCHGALADHVDLSNLDAEMKQKVIDGKFNKKDLEKKADAPVAYGWPAHLQEAHDKSGGTLLPESTEPPVIVKDPTRASVMWQCRNCHLNMISKPKDFKQFRPDPVKFKKHVLFVSGLVKPKADGKDVMCLSCHDPHDPTP